MGGFPALMIRPPESPLQQLGQVEQLKSAVQQQQLQQLQIQQEQQKISDQHALTQAMTQWDGKDYKTLPMQVLKAGGSGQAAMAMTQNVLGMKEKASAIAKDDSITAQNNAEAQAKQNDELRGRAMAVNALPLEQRQSAWDAEVTKEEQAGRIQPGQFPHQYPGEQQVTALANSFALGSTLVKEAQERQKLAQEAWKNAGGRLINTVTGEEIGGLNDVPILNSGLQSRWQVYHPGETLPDQFTLKPGASPEDFARTDKLLQATEEAARQKMNHEDAQKQLATSDALRAQMYNLSVSKEGYNWVTGTATQGPAAGKVVAVPQADIQKYGIQDAGKMEGVDVTKTQSGRQWLTLANKQAPANAPPDEKGIGQLIDELDKDGKLGPAEGRWEEFLSGKFGKGADPRFVALRTKADLSNTLLATVHSGRLGPFLMENMQGLVAAGKMDGATLKAAFNAEKDYVGDRAMDPNPPDYSKGRGAAAPANAPPANLLKEGVHTTFKNGQTWTLQNGKPVQVNQ